MLTALSLHNSTFWCSIRKLHMCCVIVELLARFHDYAAPIMSRTWHEAINSLSVMLVKGFQGVAPIQQILGAQVSNSNTRTWNIYNTLWRTSTGCEQSMHHGILGYLVTNCLLASWIPGSEGSKSDRLKLHHGATWSTVSRRWGLDVVSERLYAPAETSAAIRWKTRHQLCLNESTFGSTSAPLTV